MTVTKLSRIGAFIIGSLFVVVSVTYIIWRMNQLDNKVEIQATVLEFKKIEGPPVLDLELSTTFAPVLEYTFNDSTYTSKSESYFSKNGNPPHEIGDTISIFISPSNPNVLVVKDNFWHWVFPMIFFVLGVLVLVLSIFSLIPRTITIDTTEDLESSKHSNWLIKYGLLLIALYLIPAGIKEQGVFITDLLQDALEIEDKFLNTDIELLSGNPTFGYVQIGLGILSIVGFFILKDRFKILKFSDEDIKIRHYSKLSFRKNNKTELNIKPDLIKEESMRWSEVKSIVQLKFLRPPIYLLFLKGSKGFIIFSTRAKEKMNFENDPFSNFISLKKVKDNSELGKFVALEKKKLGS